MIHYPIPSDRRYTIALEYCGEKRPYYVVRFCGEWLDKSLFLSSAVVKAVCAKARHEQSLQVE